METVQAPGHSSTVGTSYVWEGQGVTIHLDFAVIDRLLVEVMRGFGAIPRRGAEVGGLLLGSIERGSELVIRVTDFEPIACEYRRGPSFLLSDTDLLIYEGALLRYRESPENKLYPVGCYRSHTREGLSLTAQDVSHFDKYFPEPGQVFLLIKPFATRVSVAGYFVRSKDGTLDAETPCHEFPFRRRELGGGATPASRGKESSPAGAPPSSQSSGATAWQAAADIPPGPASSTQPPLEESSFLPPPETLSTPDFTGGAPLSTEDSDSPVARFRKRNVWIPLSFLFLLLGVLVGMQLAISYRPAKTASMLNDAFRLSLGVSRAGNDLHVRWDRTSVAIKNAQRGVLTIEDGSYRGVVDLDALQLQNPNVYYRHITPVVRFRLEVFIKDNLTLVETLEWRQGS
ncbi:MAG: hypothetical protein NZV14_13565 [Bryobacteraceae bacterium]|nr:hypothetical protein [Bryobacteraceae bacterium]MDW8379186.1 hypothetical protein [Bryobacterales bacterium]